ncbi:MAG: hypothetical protein COW73_11745 [Nitrospirae bacterium CG18_big_fil_WC_8_21_14_2_50_70_55]|nr:HAMP domain-containing histidine kinase [Deltaproteobacteria bacterium]PIQ03146.1 MAG: hypothetical protein COW73_11745 [Nitrospirae bacterium CG18_big_fil_WC_8_21_14_2_50_70_55]PIW82329.1 MAG: hypothetical protein COZ96_09280 [Nitrospirae bacterium CG_4_8_14_3_um_filter_70_85]
MTRPRLDVLSMLAHDLKAPVVSIRQACAMFDDGLLGEVSGEQLEVVGMITANAATLERMVGDFLDIVRCVEGATQLHMEQVHLPAIVHAVARQLAPTLEAAHLTLTLTAAADLPPVWADGAQFQRVVTNLVANAVRYAPPASAIEVAVVGDATNQRLTLQDHGPGIPAADLDSIFSRFWQGEGVSTSGNCGLGLFLCRAILDQHGGRIWAESEAGQGARFSFEIPVDRRATARALATATATATAEA